MSAAFSPLKPGDIKIIAYKRDSDLMFPTSERIAAIMEKVSRLALIQEIKIHGDGNLSVTVHYNWKPGVETLEFTY